MRNPIEPIERRSPEPRVDAAEQQQRDRDGADEHPLGGRTRLDGRGHLADRDGDTDADGGQRSEHPPGLGSCTWGQHDPRGSPAEGDDAGVQTVEQRRSVERSGRVLGRVASEEPPREHADDQHGGAREQRRREPVPQGEVRFGPRRARRGIGSGADQPVERRQQQATEEADRGDDRWREQEAARRLVSDAGTIATERPDDEAQGVGDGQDRGRGHRDHRQDGQLEEGVEDLLLRHEPQERRDARHRQRRERSRPRR